MKKIIILFMLLFVNISAINCMSMKFQEKDQQKQEHKNKIHFSIKNKIRESFNEQEIQPSTNLAEIITEYAVFSDEEIDKANKLLWRGIEANNLNYLREAIHLGADINNKDGNKWIHTLVGAISCNKLSALRFLLQEGADINVKTFGNSVDEYFTTADHGLIVKKMLDKVRNNEPISEDISNEIAKIEAEPEAGMVFRKEPKKLNHCNIS